MNLVDFSRLTDTGQKCILVDIDDQVGSERILCKWKSLPDIINEYPDYYFDIYGNLCIGEDEDMILYCEYFKYLGQTTHKPQVGKWVGYDRYSTWYYTVIDY